MPVLELNTIKFILLQTIINEQNEAVLMQMMDFVKKSSAIDGIMQNAAQLFEGGLNTDSAEIPVDAAFDNCFDLLSQLYGVDTHALAEEHHWL